MDSTKFQRVSRTHRCPICDRPDWCLIAGPEHDPTAAICARIESRRRCGEAGWLHRLRDISDDWTRRRTFSVSAPPLAPVDFGRIAKSYRDDACFDDLHAFGYRLGVTPESLDRLGVGWSRQQRAWAFPMQSPAGAVVGIRLRFEDGRKLSVRGGKEGLFVPEGLNFNEPLFIAEGPTDAAALLDLGFNAIGRPSCTGGTRHIIDLVELRGIESVVLVADADEPGRRGAGNLASTLAAYLTEVRVLDMPPGVKDARDWKRRGGTHDDIAAALVTARRWSVCVSIQQGGHAHV